MMETVRFSPIVESRCRVGGVFGTHPRALTQPGSSLVGSEDSTHPTNLLQRPANAAVLAHAPEMHGDEQGRRQGDGDAVQYIKAQQRVAAHKASAQENKARIAP